MGASRPGCLTSAHYPVKFSDRGFSFSRAPCPGLRHQHVPCHRSQDHHHPHRLRQAGPGPPGLFPGELRFRATSWRRDASGWVGGEVLARLPGACPASSATPPGTQTIDMLQAGACLARLSGLSGNREGRLRGQGGQGPQSDCLVPTCAAPLQGSGWGYKCCPRWAVQWACAVKSRETSKVSEASLGAGHFCRSSRGPGNPLHWLRSREAWRHGPEHSLSPPTGLPAMGPAPGTALCGGR